MGKEIIKRILPVLVCIVAAMGGIRMVANGEEINVIGEEIVVNGSFEVDEDKNNIPDFRGADMGIQLDKGVRYDTSGTNAHTGKAACLTNGVNGEATINIWLPIEKLKTNTRYKLCVWIKPVENSVNSIRFRAYYFPKDGTPEGGISDNIKEATGTEQQIAEYLHEMPLAGGDYQEYTCFITTPKFSLQKLLFAFDLSGSSEKWIGMDDVSFKEVE